MPIHTMEFKSPGRAFSVKKQRHFRTKFCPEVKFIYNSRDDDSGLLAELLISFDYGDQVKFGRRINEVKHRFSDETFSVASPSEFGIDWINYLFISSNPMSHFRFVRCH